MAYEGPPNPSKLVSFIRTKLYDKGIRALEFTDWESISLPQLHVIMDKKLELLFPPLKRATSLLSDLKVTSSESASQFLERVQIAMHSGGVGT